MATRIRFSVRTKYPHTPSCVRASATVLLWEWTVASKNGSFNGCDSACPFPDNYDQVYDWYMLDLDLCLLISDICNTAFMWLHLCSNSSGRLDDTVPCKSCIIQSPLSHRSLSQAGSSIIDIAPFELWSPRPWYHWLVCISLSIWITGWEPWSRTIYTTIDYRRKMSKSHNHGVKPGTVEMHSDQRLATVCRHGMRHYGRRRKNVPEDVLQQNKKERGWRRDRWVMQTSEASR